MDVVVAHDSLHGNTKEVAEAVADGIAAAVPSAVVRRAHVDDLGPGETSSATLLVVGAPTHGSRPSPPARAFLDRLPERSLAGVSVAAFDTRVDMAELSGAKRLFGRFLDRLGYAAPRIEAALVGKGGQVVVPCAGFIVLDTQGPLRDGERERAAAWGRMVASGTAAPGAPVQMP